MANNKRIYLTHVEMEYPSHNYVEDHDERILVIHLDMGLGLGNDVILKLHKETIQELKQSIEEVLGSDFNA